MKTLSGGLRSSVKPCGAIHGPHEQRALQMENLLHGAIKRNPHRNSLRLNIGDVAVSREPVVLDTLLGSCVTVCLHDPVLGAGGMNHILLPTCPGGESSSRCGARAMKSLIEQLMELGCDRRRLVAKAFGGGNMLKGINIPPIGEKNAWFVREFLAADKIPLIAERFGGIHAVHVYFRTDTGKVTVQTIDGSALPKIIEEELSCWNTHGV